MFFNYLKTAFRSLNRNRRHALLNIAGLSVALAACIVIFLVLQYEFSHNKYLPNYGKLHHVATKFTDGEGEFYSPGTPFPTVKILRQNFPQFKFGQLQTSFGSQITAKTTDVAGIGKKFIERSGVYFADPETAELFGLKFLTGTGASLKEVNSVVISRKMALKYFDNWEHVIGRLLNFDNEKVDYQVTGVFEDQPANTDFPFEVVASYAGFEKFQTVGWQTDSWGNTTSNHQVYALLPDAKETKVLNGFLATMEKKFNKEMPGSKRSQFLNPISATHFDERLGTNGDHISSKTSLYTLAFIGLLIIFMACINFINLSTALAVKRSKEVGIRKVMGGSRTQLQIQVFAETFLVVLFAVLIALLLAWIALPYVKNIMAVQESLHLWSPGSMLFLLAIVLITTLLSGLYPAFVMGKFQPVEAIKNKINTSRVGSISLRRILVVLQFAFSQMLVIATIVVVAQMNYIKKTDLGFNKEAVLLLNGNTDSATLARLQPFREALLSRADVAAVSNSFDAPSSGNSWQSNFAFDIMEDKDFSVNIKLADENYLKTYGIELLAGSSYGQSDTTTGLIVNETLINKVGLKSPAEAIGKMLRIGGETPKPVVGVVKDFKSLSLKEAVPPIVIKPSRRFYNTTGIKLRSSNLPRSYSEIETLWNSFFPDLVFSARYFDESINEFYLKEERLSLMYRIYALLALFISCLGLYGLISFMVVQKTKEVGIRKVLGAGINSIVYLFSKEFTILIGIAFLIAVPTAWYFMSHWLADFKFRINIGLWVFACALLISLFIAWLTVGFKAVKAALANPVKSLRTE